MSLVYPTSPGFRAIGLKMSDPTITFRSQNGKRISRKVGGHLWSFTLTYPPMTKEQFRPIIGFLAKVRGRYNTFTITPPNLATPLGTQVNDTTVNADRAAGNTSVNVTGNPLSTYKAGDVVKFSGHNKVYMLTDDATANASGVATLNFEPPLTTALTLGEAAKHSNVPFTVALTGDLQEISANVAGFYNYELDVEEVF